MQTIHGHTIMHWLSEAQSPLSFSQLEARTRQEFGADVRFKTCNTKGHTLSELLAILEARGKIIADDDGYTVNAHTMCAED